jgi:Ca2+-dependent lipid-binding protein
MENNRVDWMQELLIPVEIPIVDDKLTLQVWDQDNLIDELACSVLFSLKSLLKYDITKNPDNTGLIKWVNLYGCHRGYSGSNCDR